MHFRFLVFLFLAFALKLSAQVKQEYQIDLNRHCWLRAWATSQVQNIEDQQEYQFLALSAYTFDTTKQIELQWRYRHQKEWSQWVPLTVPHEGPTPGRQAFAAEPVEISIDAWQIRSSDSLKQPLVVRIFKAPAEKKSPGQKPLAASTVSCNCPPPPLCDRSCWCPDGSCAPPANYTPTQPSHLIVHHSAGFSNYNDYQWVVAYYWDLHVNTNGWSDIGYNFLIDRNGVVYEGRGSGNLGAHFSCLNGKTVGICLIGNFMNEKPQALALQKLIDLAAWESCNHQISPADSSLHQSSQLVLRHLSGHRDANPAQVGCPSGTVCPGDSLYPLLDSLAQVINQKACLLGQVEWSVELPQLYPNPSQNGQSQLFWPFHTKGQLQVYNAQGLLLKQKVLKPGLNPIDTRKLASGHYLLELRKGDYLHQVKLLVP
jgi:hypothetical protein